MRSTIAWIIVSVLGVVGLITLITFLSSFTIIDPGERGVSVVLGKVGTDVLGEGFHWKTPFTEDIRTVDVKLVRYEENAGAASKDLQTVNAAIAVNYHVDASQVPKLLQEIGPDYQKIVLPPALQESVKAVTSRFTAEELITKRTEVKEAIRTVLMDRLKKNYLVVDDVSIVNFAFSPEFAQAIELKQTAEQQALKQKWELERVKVEAQQKIETAKAEAESLRLQKEQITPEMVQLRAIEKWNGVLPQTTAAGAVPFINVK